MQLRVASSPQTAGDFPPASITITSPAFALSILSTAFAQSPENVRTVNAFPLTFIPGFIGLISFITCALCIASLILAVETFLKISKISSSEPTFLNSDFTEISFSIASFTFPALSATFLLFVIAAPTIIVLQNFASSPAFSEFIPPATAIFFIPAFTNFSTSSEIFIPLICWSIPR